MKVVYGGVDKSEGIKFAMFCSRITTLQIIQYEHGTFYCNLGNNPLSVAYWEIGAKIKISIIKWI